MNYRVLALRSFKGLVLTIPKDVSTTDPGVYPIVKSQMTVNPNISYPDRFSFGVFITGYIDDYVWVEEHQVCPIAFGNPSSATEAVDVARQRGHSTYSTF